MKLNNFYAHQRYYRPQYFTHMSYVKIRFDKCKQGFPLLGSFQIVVAFYKTFVAFFFGSFSITLQILSEIWWIGLAIHLIDKGVIILTHSQLLLLQISDYCWITHTHTKFDSKSLNKYTVFDRWQHERFVLTFYGLICSEILNFVKDENLPTMLKKLSSFAIISIIQCFDFFCLFVFHLYFHRLRRVNKHTFTFWIVIIMWKII